MYLSSDVLQINGLEFGCSGKFSSLHREQYFTTNIILITNLIDVLDSSGVIYQTHVVVPTFSTPRVSNPIDGIEPMNLLELARLWINPSVQNLTFEDKKGKTHSL